MAVIEEVPHITVRVLVAGELATEYEAPNDSDMIDNPGIANPAAPSKQCYIECKSGAEFAIEIKVSHGVKMPLHHDLLAFYVYIDGKRMASTSLSTLNLSYLGDFIQTISSSAVPSKLKGQVQRKKFVFSPVTKNDGASEQEIQQDVLRAKDLGTIRLAIETATFIRNVPYVPYDNGGQTSNLAEKALKGKAISHGTILSGTTDATLAPGARVQSKDKRPLGDIFFYYRSHKSLQQEMILPRTPSPEPRANNMGADLSHLSEGEIRQLALERLRDTKVKQESLQIKREANGSPHSPRTWKVVKLDDGKEAVDLTDE